jgi:hypothetical protein
LTKQIGVMANGEASGDTFSGVNREAGATEQNETTE